MSSASEVAAAVRALILSGGLPPGARLQSLAEAAATYGVHPAVVRRAYQALVRTHLVEGRQGDGYYALDPKDVPPAPEPAPSLEDRVADLEARVQRLERRGPKG